MKINIRREIDTNIEVKYLMVSAEVRYWEDATVNGIEDTDGTLIPCRRGPDFWCPTIDLDTGIIINWVAGVSAQIHYKVCDAGEYYVLSSNRNIVLRKEGYVPAFLRTRDSGSSDYIIFDVNEDGQIIDWIPPSGFSGFELTPSAKATLIE